jgi:meiosis induction protein kinase IME2/SME1
MSPTADDTEAEAGCAPWASSTNRQSVIEPKTIAPQAQDPSADPNFAELDRALQSVRYSLDAAANPANMIPVKQPVKMHSNPALKRHHSLPHAADAKSSQTTTGSGSMRARRSVKHSTNSRYETPDEEDELLDEAINSAHRAAKRLNNAPAQQQKTSQPPLPQVASEPGYHVPYLTPSPSKDQIGSQYTAQQSVPSKPLDIPANRTAKGSLNPQWPTPPYEENDWASAAAASIFATQAAYR